MKRENWRKARNTIQYRRFVSQIKIKRTGQDNHVADGANKSVFGIEVGDLQIHVELKI